MLCKIKKEEKNFKLSLIDTIIKNTWNLHQDFQDLDSKCSKFRFLPWLYFQNFHSECFKPVATNCEVHNLHSNCKKKPSLENKFYF